MEALPDELLCAIYERLDNRSMLLFRTCSIIIYNQTPIARVYKLLHMHKYKKVVADINTINNHVLAIACSSETSEKNIVIESCIQINLDLLILHTYKYKKLYSYLQEKYSTGIPHKYNILFAYSCTTKDHKREQYIEMRHVILGEEIHKYGYSIIKEISSGKIC